MNTKVVDVKIKRLFNPTMILQIILIIALLVVGIIYIFNHNINNIFHGLCAANLLLLAYHNYKIMHKKYMSITFIIIAIYLIISIIIDIW